MVGDKKTFTFISCMQETFGTVFRVESDVFLAQNGCKCIVSAAGTPEKNFLSVEFTPRGLGPAASGTRNGCTT